MWLERNGYMHNEGLWWMLEMLGGDGEVVVGGGGALPWGNWRVNPIYTVSSEQPGDSHRDNISSCSVRVNTRTDREKFSSR